MKKKDKMNLLTVALAVLIMVSGVLFAYFLLPVITEDKENYVMKEDIKLTNPQEIIEVPWSLETPEYAFLYTFSGREVLKQETLDEKTVQSRKNFLNAVSVELDIAFNLKIDAIILEKYTDVWRYTEDKMEQSARDTSDVFSVDVYFTDARSTRWRIVAVGFEDEVFQLTCLEDDEVTATPPVFTTQPYYGNRIELSEEQQKAANRFEAKLYQLPAISNIIGKGIYLELGYSIVSLDGEVIWTVHLVSDNRYLVSGMIEDTLTPFSYTFVNLNSEMKSDRNWDE